MNNDRKRRDQVTDLQTYYQGQRHKGHTGESTPNEQLVKDKIFEEQERLKAKQPKPSIVIIESGGQDDDVNDYDGENLSGDGNVDKLVMNGLLESLSSSEQRPLDILERVSREDVLDWIRQQYEAEGFQRELTAQDEIGLLKQAGFSSRHMDLSITESNFNSFCDRFNEALHMLRLVSVYWNMENPNVIAGFDCDKVRAEGALKSAAPGTFVLRMSFGEFGKLVISIVTKTEDIVHYVIQVEHFANRSLGQILMKLGSAEKLMDVFSNRLIEKKKIYSEGEKRLD